MSTIRRMTTTLAAGALVLTGGSAGAPAALADGPDTPHEVIVEIEAMEWPEYEVGDSDIDIAVAGYLLRYLGHLPDDYELPNSDFTEELEDAVLEFQTDGDIDVPDTGRLDQETWDNLRKEIFGTPMGQGRIGDPVCAVQHSLIHDYDKDITHDCRFGPETEGAVKEVQRDFGIDDDGLVGVITFRAMIAGGV
ncbi:peptidoglycan hydrolase-like protein with peptidoglycan-binding domain [Lipingzhangella halophila]|uniref:Peptidoglycan hydrolase-like protein with peptidoglycan-binding domain n=1 Tax=Lipingzhangella halophila TaxID=1783352 RepID=A0A7W7RG33_9ACTN|nr:peptidoglycan-binding protein [Lipingzhangella halophila]MBB4931013.1 peptidoglycan hydrolase-like protein with peptidoglycan-binding domain [Lipingzhangella halophila]